MCQQSGVELVLMSEINPEENQDLFGRSQESPDISRPVIDSQNAEIRNEQEEVMPLITRLGNFALGSFVLGGATAGMTLSTYVIMDSLDINKVISAPVSILSGIAVFAGTFNAWKRKPRQ